MVLLDILGYFLAEIIIPEQCQVDFENAGMMLPHPGHRPVIDCPQFYAGILLGLLKPADFLIRIQGRLMAPVFRRFQMDIHPSDSVPL